MASAVLCSGGSVCFIVKAQKKLLSLNIDFLPHSFYLSSNLLQTWNSVVLQGIFDLTFLCFFA